MTTSGLVKDLLDLPDQIRKGDFVLKLTEGIEDAARTAQTYVVTPALADAFDRALALVGSALGDGTSQAAYLHGSFGSGKSHFMALLSLLLDGNEDAWRVAELHPLRQKHGYVGNKNILELHFHMVGQDSIEAAVFGEYLDFAQQHHPDAPIPSLFADEKLFADAAAMLAELGDEAFFAPMNQGKTAQSGWGQVGDRWDRARFEQAVSSTDPKLRGKLFDALARTRFGSFAQESRAFTDLDTGLAVIAGHAAALGYDCIVLFLDELILWLAGRASEAAWLHTEAQKMVKLVEAEQMHRDIPLVSFIARQRDLADMVGEDYAGAENARLRDSLKWWEGRYDKIVLEDKNLPAIVERRVLKPRDEAAKVELDLAFDNMKRAAGSSWETMLGTLDGDAFRKLYPFSPALVEALVALSNSLQRQRTAIKLLNEILVEHIEDLKVGEVVRVGDLYDVLASGDDSADGVMRSRFEAAKQIYKYQFLPLIQSAHGTDTEDKCFRIEGKRPTRFGCSGCGQKACRTDNRLVKTLLVAALVPEVGALKDLTASKLVQLNHGTLKVPIAGTEAGIVAQRLRDWASQIGQLHVGSQNDPAVRLQLEGVDVVPILDQAREHDTPGARQRVIRDLLFEAMGVDKVADWGKDHKVEWRKTRRIGHIRFGNVRKMGTEPLRCPDNHDWRLIVDYPFDDPGFGPNDDLDILEDVIEQGTAGWTLAWLPSFFSDATNKLLGELTILEHILDTRQTARRYVSHLSVENQERALTDLENLHSMKKTKLEQVLVQAYGLADAKEGALDSSRCLDNHLYVLKPGAKLQPRLAPNLSEALEDYIDALLASRYPRHPHFSHRVGNKQLAADLIKSFGDIIDSGDGRIPAERDLVDKMRGTLGELGLVRVTENAVHLVEDRTLQEIEKKRQQQGDDQPTVGEIKRWNDDKNRMGLQPDAADLVVRAYARWAARTFVHLGKPYSVQPGVPIPDDVELEKPELPSAHDWNLCRTLAGHAFGLSAGKALHADNLKSFEADLAATLAAATGAVTRLPGALAMWAEELGVVGEADRLRTARSADDLCAKLANQRGVDQVRILAEFVPETSPRAVGSSIAQAAGAVALLDNKLVLGVFAQLRARQQDVVGAAEVRERAAKALRQDEINEALAPRLRALAEEGQGLLAGPPPPTVPAESVVLTRSLSASGRVAVVAALAELSTQAEAALQDGDESVELRGSITITRKPKA